jgi:glycosyltransferase involved in cell wall biosynthesis
MSENLRVSLLAPYPVRMKFGDQLKFNTTHSIEHPASWVTNLLRMASENCSDIEFHLISSSSHLAQDSYLEKDRIHYHFLRGIPFRLQAITGYKIDRILLQRVLKKVKPTVVEAFGTEGPFAYAGVTSNYPCVVYMQGIVTEILKQAHRVKLPFIQWLNLYLTQHVERWTIRNAKYFISENEFSAKFVRKLNPRANINMIPNLINPIYFNIERNPEELNQDILFIGSISEIKGAFDLLFAFVSVHKRFPKCRLIMVGTIDPDTYNRFTKLAQQYDFQKSIQLLGLQSPENISSIMSRAAMLVHPSWMDSSPNSVLEAMAAGMPVIASRVGGIPYMIEDGVNGILCDVNRIDYLTEKICYLLEKPKEGCELGERANKIMKQNYNPEQVINRTIQLYRQLANNF